MMYFMFCPRCKSIEKIKNGVAHGIQRYRCKNCGCNYTKSNVRGYGLEIKNRVFFLYQSGKSFREIEKETGISNVTVMRWIKSIQS